MKYIRTDKNGTKIYHDYTCQRCSGQGASEAWKFTGMTCYECGGTGLSKLRVIREYTPEYQAVLNAKREARAAKREEMLRKEAEEKKQAWINEEFPEGCIYIVMGKTYNITEELKKAGAEWTSRTGWMFKHKPEGFTTVEMTADQCIRYDHYGFPYHAHDIYDRAEEKFKAMQPTSEYIGTVGEKLTVTAIYQGSAYYEFIGTTYIHQFRTAEGNLLVWKTGTYLTTEEGALVEITATVKDHSEYRKEKQTVLTRAKIKEVSK